MVRWSWARGGTVVEGRRRDWGVGGVSNEIVAGHGLDAVLSWRGTPVSMRSVYAHLLTELARHAGHGEILVEKLRARRGADEPDD